MKSCSDSSKPCCTTQAHTREAIVREIEDLQVGQLADGLGDSAWESRGKVEGKCGNEEREKARERETEKDWVPFTFTPTFLSSSVFTVCADLNSRSPTHTSDAHLAQIDREYGCVSVVLHGERNDAFEHPPVDVLLPVPF